MFDVIKKYKNNLGTFIKILSNHRYSKGSPRVCLVYYQEFCALSYREAKALTKVGIVVDALCYWTIKDSEKPRIVEGINVYPIHARRSREKSTIAYMLGLAQFFLKAVLFLSYSGILKRYAAIHITTPPDFLVFAALIPKLRGAKIIMDIHDIGPEFYMRRLGVDEYHVAVKIIKLIEKLSTRFADHVIAVTDLWRNKLIDRSVSPSKCTTILNVPDEVLFQIPDETKSKLANGFNLFYHGSLEELFGVDTLIHAMPKIVEHIPNVILHIYGGGRLFDSFKALVHQLNIDDYVKLHKGVPFSQLPSILAQADIGIVPTKDSVFSDEILAMKSLEYISLGIPIVISKTKGHEYYYNSSMVNFFKPGDKSSLAEAVIELYKNDTKRQTLKFHSRSFIEKYGWQNTKETYIGIFQDSICKTNIQDETTILPVDPNMKNGKITPN